MNINNYIIMPLPADIICYIGEFYCETGRQWLEYRTMSHVCDEFQYHDIHINVVLYSVPQRLLPYKKIKLMMSDMASIQYILDNTKPRIIDMSKCGISGPITLQLDGVKQLDLSFNDISGNIISDTLQLLNIEHTNIQKIDAKALRTLYCTGCIGITLPFAPNLRFLSCNSCRLNCVLPDYPHLEELYAYNNIRLIGTTVARHGYTYKSGISLRK